MKVEQEIVGRETELAAIAAFLDGPPGVLLIEGPPGIGKTTLWRWALDEATHRSFQVLPATPRGSEVELSFAGLGDLLGPLAGTLVPLLPPPQGRALAEALLLAEPGSGASSRTALAAACLSALRRLAAQERVLIAVDDVQWMDASSAQVLGYATRRLTTERIWLLLARRTNGADEPVPFELAHLPASRRPQRVAVGALSLGALHRMLRLKLGASFPRPMLTRLRDVSGGNPLYALELARWIARREGDLEPGRPLSLPPTLIRLIDDRLAAQPAEVRTALAAAAALSRPTVAAVGDELALDAAREAGFVELRGNEIVFTHPLIAAAAYQALGARRRKALHAQLAQLVTDPEERVRHLALGVGTPRPDVAASLEDAAARAAARGAPDGAAQLMDLAVRMTPMDRPADLLRRRFGLGEYLKSSGEHVGARGVFSALVAELPPGPQRARALHRVAGGRGDVIRSRALHEQALAESGRDVALRVEAHVTLSILSLVGGDLTAARDEANEAAAAAEATDDHAARARALGNLGLLDALAGIRHPDDFWSRALAEETAAGEPDAYGPRQSYGMALMYADRLDEARSLLVDARRDAVERGLVNVQSSLDLHLTELECRAGNLPRAREYAEDAFLLTVQPGVGQPEAGALYALAFVSMYQGSVSEARRLATEGLAKADAYGDRIFRAQNLAVLGFLELSLNDAAAAYRALEGVADELVAGGYGEPSVYPILPNTIEALIRLGRPEDARRFLTILEQQGLRLDSAWAMAQAHRYRGLLAADAGDVDGAIGEFDAALAEHARMPGPFERGRTLLCTGQTLRRAKRRREARDALTAAIAVFEAVGTPLWFERAREELARVGGRRAEPGLTPTERRVAELAAEGLSNKEVAAALFVTVSSVERHLTRIYEKLGIASRVELARTIGSRSA